MSVEIKTAYDAIADIKVLFTEYTQSLGLDLSYQQYDKEFAGLPGSYAPPDGRLYIAYVGGAVAGCIALRRFDDDRCEMKRLYVRPVFRGQRIGALLAAQVIADARQIGYQSMLLDTLASMESALALYQTLGFVEIAPYYDSPVQQTRYFSLAI